jgi:hypothetical protein
MIRNLKKGRKTAAVAAALPVFVAFVSVLFFAAAYVVHDCADEGCFVCAQIQRGFETWQRFWDGMTGVFSAVSSGVAVVFFLFLSAKLHPVEQRTPVSAKIRLNN